MANHAIIWGQMRDVLSTVLDIDASLIRRDYERSPTSGKPFIILDFLYNEESRRQATIGRYRIQYVNGDGAEADTLDMYFQQGLGRRLASRMPYPMEVLVGEINRVPVIIGDRSYNRFVQEVRIGYLRELPTVPKFISVGDINVIVSPGDFQEHLVAFGVPVAFNGGSDIILFNGGTTRIQFNTGD